MSFACRIHIVLAVCLLAEGGVSAFPEVPTLSLTPDIATTRCSNDQMGRIYEDRTIVQLLADFGLDTKAEIWNCSVIGTPWLKSGTILVLRTVPSASDSVKEVTLVHLDREPGYWLIPVSFGMLSVGHVEDDIHNRAALNAVVSSSQFLPKRPEDWLSLALLYMNMTGNEIHVADSKAYGEPISGLQSRYSMLRKLKLLPSVECSDNGCDVTINDTRYAEANGTYTAWVFGFSISRDQVLLDSVVTKQKPFRTHSGLGMRNEEQSRQGRGPFPMSRAICWTAAVQ